MALTVNKVNASFSADGTTAGYLTVSDTTGFSLDAAGKHILTAADSSATPGAATLNNIAGKSAIAAGATSVVITNSNCTANSIVTITPLDIDTTATRYKVTPAAGSFTVTTNAATTAAWRFNWVISAN